MTASQSNSAATSPATSRANPPVVPTTAVNNQTQVAAPIPFPKNVPLDQIRDNLFEIVAVEDHGQLLHNATKERIDTYVRYSLGLANGYQSAFAIFDHKDVSLADIKNFGESVFNQIPEDKIKEHFPVGNTNAMYSYLFFLLKKHHNVTTENKDWNKYNWSRMQLEGFFELANNSDKIAGKYANQHQAILYCETGLGFGLNLQDLPKTDQKSLNEHLQLGSKLLETVFEHCLRNDQFSLFFDEAFEPIKGSGSYQDRYNTLSNFYTQLIFLMKC